MRVDVLPAVAKSGGKRQGQRARRSGSGSGQRSVRVTMLAGAHKQQTRALLQPTLHNAWLRVVLGLAALMLGSACSGERPWVGPDAAVRLDAADIAWDAQQLDAQPDAASACPGKAGCPCLQPDDCDDNDPCTWGQDCVDGACTSGFAEVCDDQNSCTADTCTPAGCSHTQLEGVCSDGDPCTVGDRCQQASCVAGPTQSCDDGKLCTTDQCAPGLGCQHLANQLECEAENACMEASFCALGSCVPGKTKPCTDANPCTADTCDPIAGCESWPLPDPAPCPPGSTTAMGRCWLALPGSWSWQAARQACRDNGMELASLANRYEQEAGQAAIAAACGEASAWLGYTDRAREGSFVWSDGRSSRWDQWGSGEPNNWGADPGEDAVELTPAGLWNDLADGAELPCALCARPLASACEDSGPCTAGDVCTAGKCALGPPEDCDDHNACTLDSCSDKPPASGGGCQHQALGLASDATVTCGAGTCQTGTCWLQLPEAPTSCAAASPDAVAVVALDVDGPGPQGLQWHRCWPGGWTQALAVSGSDGYGAYASDLWTDAVAGGDPADVLATSKTAAFWSMPVQSLRIGLRWQGTVRWQDVPLPSSVTAADGSEQPVTGQTLQALFASNTPIATQLGLLAWQGLMGQGSLQGYCHLEGLNTGAAGQPRVRIGILGNNEANCDSVDSWIGIGASGGPCNTQLTPSAGNVACYNPDWGSGTKAAVGYVLVR